MKNLVFMIPKAHLLNNVFLFQKKIVRSGAS
jgi:hypothetical protein